MVITAAQVKELRQQTGCGMMDCKKALLETAGDMEAAVEFLRKKGVAQADKKATRIASEGLVIIKTAENNKAAVMLEINSETDFVARDENFVAFADLVADKALALKVQTLEELLEQKLASGITVENARKELIAKIGENINIRRVVFMETSGILGAYLHGSRIGVLVALVGGDAALAKDLAMHVAASKPIVVVPEQLDAAQLVREQEIYTAQALESGKPENIIDKIVAGKIKKYVNEVSLVGQPFVKNPDSTVGELLQNNKAQVEAFVRFELGEGIEKKVEDFAKEVQAQVEASKS